MKLIGFCGLMGSGKTFAADYLVEKYGYTKVKFAKPLKDMLRTIGLTDEHIEGSLKELPCDLLDGRTPRWAMQSLGTEWGRTCISENLWGNLWEREVQSLLSKGKRVVVDDCRFDNEAQRIQKMSGFLILMKALTEDDANAETHASESIPANPNATLLNPKDEPESIKHALDALLALDKRRNRAYYSQGGFAMRAG